MNLAEGLWRCEVISAEFARRKEIGLPFPTLAELDEAVARAVESGQMIAFFRKHAKPQPL